MVHPRGTRNTQHTFPHRPPPLSADHVYTHRVHRQLLTMCFDYNTEPLPSLLYSVSHVIAKPKTQWPKPIAAMPFVGPAESRWYRSWIS